MSFPTLKWWFFSEVVPVLYIDIHAVTLTTVCVLFSFVSFLSFFGDVVTPTTVCVVFSFVSFLSFFGDVAFSEYFFTVPVFFLYGENVTRFFPLSDGIFSTP